MSSPLGQAALEGKWTIHLLSACDAHVISKAEEQMVKLLQ